MATRSGSLDLSHYLDPRAVDAKTYSGFAFCPSIARGFAARSFKLPKRDLDGIIVPVNDVMDGAVKLPVARSASDGVGGGKR